MREQWMRRDEEGRWVKYCRTCHVWRPPRASHCAICGYCMVRPGACTPLAVCFSIQHHAASLARLAHRRRKPV